MLTALKRSACNSTVLPNMLSMLWTMLPRRNEKDLDDVPQEARDKLEFVFLDRVEDVVRTGLGVEPETLRKAA